MKDYDAIIFDLGVVILDVNYQLTIDAFHKMGVKNFKQYFTKLGQVSCFDGLDTGKLSANEFCEAIRKLSRLDLTNLQIPHFLK